MKVEFDGAYDIICAEMRLFIAGSASKIAPTAPISSGPTPGAQGEENTPNEAVQPAEKAAKKGRKGSKAAVRKTEPDPEPEDDNGDDGGEIIDRAMLRAKCKEVIETHDKAKLVELLAEIGCKTFGDVKEEQFVDLLRLTEEVL